MQRAVFCHYRSDTVQNSPGSSGVNRKNPISRNLAIEITARVRMFIVERGFASVRA